MNAKLQKEILKAGKTAHAKITKAILVSFFAAGNEKARSKFERASLKFNQLMLEQYSSKMSDKDGADLLRQINNSPFEVAKALKDTSRILWPQQRGRAPLLSDSDRRQACLTFDTFRRDGHTRKAAIEKTVTQFGLTAQQMEGILRHRSRNGDV